MANMTCVDGEKLRNTASLLADIDLDIISCVEKFLDVMSELDQGWQSEVKGEFWNVWEKDCEALCEMMGQYEEINNILHTAAEQFDSSERNVISEIRKLK